MIPSTYCRLGLGFQGFGVVDWESGSNYINLGIATGRYTGHVGIHPPTLPEATQSQYMVLGRCQLCWPQHPTLPQALIPKPSALNL